MNALKSLTKRNLKLNKKRAVVTTIGIILSVALISALGTLYTSGIASLIDYEKQIKGNFHALFHEVSTDELSLFENNRAFENIYTTSEVGYGKIPSQNEDKPYVYIQSLDEEALKEMNIQLESGRLPVKDDEIVISKHIYTNGRVKYKLGDTLTLDIGQRTIDSYTLNQQNPYDENETFQANQTKTYKIVGIMPRMNNSVESYTAPGYTVFTYGKSPVSSYVDVYVQVKEESVEDIYKVIGSMIGVNPDLYERIRTRNSFTSEEMERYESQMDMAKYQVDLNDYLISLQTQPLSEGAIGGLGIVAGIVMIIIMATSIFCIKNSFDISMTEKIKQYGMLRSIGATKKQIRKNVYYEASILALYGIPLGILSGLFASYILIHVCNYFLHDVVNASNIILHFELSYVAIIISIILSIITIYLSALSSAIKASRISPIESLRNSGKIILKAKSIKSPKWIRKCFGMGGELSYKNIKRNKRKYRTTTISLIVSVAVFVGLSGFISLAFDVTEMEYGSHNYSLSFETSDTSSQMKEKIKETTSLDYIDDYTIYQESHMAIDTKYYSDELKTEEDENIYIHVLSINHEKYQDCLKELDISSNDTKNKVILCDYNEHYIIDEKTGKDEYKILKDTTLEVGDRFQAMSDEKQLQLEVLAISNQKPRGYENYNLIIALVDENTFNDSFKCLHTQAFYTSSNTDKLQDDIDVLLGDYEYSMTNYEQQMKQTKGLFTLVAIFLYGFITVITLIGVTSVFNTLTTSMELRKQEFAMLKSVGMTHNEFNKMIQLESIFIGMKALMIALPIGIAISYAFYYFLEHGSLSYQLPVLGIIISILAVFIFVHTIMKYAMSKIETYNTIETIRNENI